jgi:multisubunit Na+/H+ antiporter MnhG subunit
MFFAGIELFFGFVAGAALLVGALYLLRSEKFWRRAVYAAIYAGMGIATYALALFVSHRH